MVTKACHVCRRVTGARDRLVVCFGLVRKIELRIAALVPKAFPIGDRVYYRHGADERAATVLEHHGDNLKVRGATGAEYWLDVRKTLDD